MAYLNVASSGYTVHVRDADTGAVRWISQPWNAPLPQDVSTSKPARIPDLAMVSQGGEEYIVAWGHGVSGTDALHNGREVVELAIYPVKTTGKAVKPLHEVSVPVSVGRDILDVRGTANGLLITWGEGLTLRTHGASVDMATGRVARYTKVDELLPQCEDTWCVGADVVGVTDRGPVVRLPAGGFGVPDRWFSKDVAPRGALNAKTTMGGWTGKVEAATYKSLVAVWRTEGGDPIWAVHDAATGKVLASTKCSTETLRPDEDRPAYPAVTSMNGRYLVAGPLAFDVQKGTGQCLAGDGDRKTVLLASVQDDGTAYGTVANDDLDDIAQTAKAQVPVETGVPTALSVDTEVPLGPLKNSAVFLTRDDSDFLRISVLRRR
ncbi:hypothetical protein [Streptomyces sp. SAJ15]|uniref:hypothetical protein n=1 Tax=Streptomyces sp. SAJ15 TaxID=2011095 RepID=UPI001186BAA1|nr:hypothetical protein [Streptomyces sp. SAJ15]